jgi:hypothetical protein
VVLHKLKSHLKSMPMVSFKLVPKIKVLVKPKRLLLPLKKDVCLGGEGAGDGAAEEETEEEYDEDEL